MDMFMNPWTAPYVKCEGVGSPTEIEENSDVINSASDNLKVLKTEEDEEAAQSQPKPVVPPPDSHFHDYTKPLIKTEHTPNDTNKSPIYSEDEFDIPDCQINGLQPPQNCPFKIEEDPNPYCCQTCERIVTPTTNLFACDPGVTSSVLEFWRTQMTEYFEWRKYRYHCPHCDSWFMHYAIWHHHMKNFHPEVPQLFRCGVRGSKCKRFFYSEPMVQRHEGSCKAKSSALITKRLLAQLEAESRNPPVKKTAPVIHGKNVEKPVKKEENSGMFSCCECGKTVFGKTNLKRHVKMKHGRAIPVGTKIM